VETMDSLDRELAQRLGRVSVDSHAAWQGFQRALRRRDARRRVATAGVALGVFVLASLVALGPLTQMRRGPAEGSSGAEGTASTYEGTRSLHGEQLVEALGLTPIPYEKDISEVFAGCPDRGWVIGDPSGGNVAYCTAEVTDNPVEGWDISERIAGRTPTEEQLEALELEIQADVLSEQGRQEEASDLRDQAHELRRESSGS
jgi:hypothetical protein